MERALQISVIGGSSCDAATADIAEKVGRRLAAAGAVLVCGGYGGVMAAACRGARAVGGTTIGILRGYDHDEGNAELTLALPTGMRLARNILVVAAGEAVIAIDGSYGTLSEIALALNIDRPVVSLGSWNPEAGARRGGRGSYRGTLEIAESPDAAVERALALARERREEKA